MRGIFRSKWLFSAVAVLIVTIVGVALISLRIRQRPLTTIASIWKWSNTHRSPRPIKLRAIVTYYDPSWRILDVQSQGEGLFLDPTASQPLDAHPGTEVEITGFSAIMPAISQLSIKPIRSVAMPQPISATIGELAAGKHAGLFVTTTGIVRWVKTLDSRTTIKIADGAQFLNVRILNPSAELVRIAPSSLVRVSGVASPPREGTHSPAEVFITSAQDLKVIQSAPADVFSLPMTPVEDLGTLGEPATQDRAVHVRQRLLSQSSDGDWIIGTSASNEIHLRPLERVIADPGETVDAVGFPSTDGQDVVIADANVRIWNSSQPEKRRIITKASKVTALGPSEAAAGLPVRLLANVSFFDPWWRLLFVEDETGGVYVEDVPPNLLLKAGDLLELDGETRAGGFIPDVARPSIRVLWPGKLKPARSASTEELLSGKYDSRRVELTGVVQGYSYVPEQKRIVLDVVSGRITVKVQMLSPEKIGSPSSLVDCKVRLVGVAGSLMNQNMQMMGISLFVQDPSEMQVLESGPSDPFASPLLDIKTLLRSRPSTRFQHRVHVAGVVLAQEEKIVYVRDSSGVIAARVNAPLSARPGDIVHLAGFIAPGSTRPILVQTIAEVRGRDSVPIPKSHSSQEILEGTYDSDLVATEGTVLSSASSSRGWELLLQSESHTFNAVLQTDPKRRILENIQPGAVVRVTGIAEMQPSPNTLLPTMMSFRVHLRDGSDIRVISTPSWWSIKRIVVVASLCSLVIAVTLAWVLMLKRQVRQQTAVIHQQATGLVHVEKLASIGQLVAGVAHELNNPLAAVIGYSDLLMDDVRAEHNREKLKKLGNEARRMKRIIDNLLHFARPKIRGRELVDLEHVIRGAMSLHEYNLQCRGITVDLNFQAGIPKVEVDEDQMKQVFLNLFNNSLQALAASNQKHISVTVQRDGDSMVVSFADSGPGFEDVHRAFDPFYTTKPVGQGTGLGLSICYGIIKEHGGDIHAQNQHPSGARVTIRLPLCAKDASAAQIAAGLS